MQELFTFYPSIENRFAIGRMPAGTMLSYGMCSEYTDLSELLLLSFCGFYKFSKINSNIGIAYLFIIEEIQE